MNCEGKCFSGFCCECKCFENCECDYDQECECDHLENCFYIENPHHKECVVYCKYSPMCEQKCELLKCDNFFICKVFIPEFVKKRNDGICDGCYLSLGKLKENIVKTCDICFDDKKTVKLTCGHDMCADCFEKWAMQNEDRTCPFCRRCN